MLFACTLLAAVALAMVFAAAVHGGERAGKDRLANGLLMGYTDA